MNAEMTQAKIADTQAQLDDQQVRRGLFFGDKPLCTVLRPRFFTLAQYQLLSSRVRVLMRAFGAKVIATDSPAERRWKKA